MPGTVLLRQVFGGKRRRYSPANKREQQEENDSAMRSGTSVEVSRSAST